MEVLFRHVTPFSLHYQGATMENVPLILSTMNTVLNSCKFHGIIKEIRECTDAEPHIDIYVIHPPSADPHPAIAEVNELIAYQLCPEKPCYAYN